MYHAVAWCGIVNAGALLTIQEHLTAHHAVVCDLISVVVAGVSWAGPVPPCCTSSYCLYADGVVAQLVCGFGPMALSCLHFLLLCGRWYKSPKLVLCRTPGFILQALSANPTVVGDHISISWG